MKTLLSHVLKRIAKRLDGHEPETRGSRLHLVRNMNAYIGRSEGYIIALEEALVSSYLDDEGAGKARLKQLREEHHRFDTKPLQDAGAWKQEEKPCAD